MYVEIRVYDDDGKPLEEPHIFPPVKTREREDMLTDSIICDYEWHFTYRKREKRSYDNKRNHD